MTPPTPTERDREVTVAAYWEVENERKRHAVANYRAELQAEHNAALIAFNQHLESVEKELEEANIEITHARMATASAIEQRDENRVRITALLDALDKAEKALHSGLTVCKMCPVNPTAYQHQIEEALTTIRSARVTQCNNPPSPPESNQP